MRLSTVFLHCSALLHCAAAKDAYLYTFNDEHSPSTDRHTISSTTAFAIASRRQGVTDGLSLEGVDEHSLLQISRYGGYQQNLFSKATTADPTRVLVRIQAKKPELSQTGHTKSNFKIHKPTADLLSLGSARPDAENHRFEFSSQEGVRLVYDVRDKVRAFT